MITITDSTSGTPLKYTNTYTVTLGPIQGTLPNGAPEDTSVNATIPLATFAADARPSGIPAGYQITFTPSTTGTIETLLITRLFQSCTDGNGGDYAAGRIGWTGAGAFDQCVGNGHSARQSGRQYRRVGEFPGTNCASGTYKLYFNYGGPVSDAAVTSYSARCSFAGRPDL